jgi:two-component system response regulator CpxR
LGPSTSGRAALLIVEDDESLRETLALVLSGEGFEVVLAGTGEEALALMAEVGPFAALYTDINLPGPADGWQVGAAFHARWPTRPVVYASGRDWPAARLRPTEVFLRKPFQLEVLIDLFAPAAGGDDRMRSDRSRPAIRTLVIDDEPAVRTMIRRVLEDAGHRVVEAEDGHAGLRLFREMTPDLVVVDMFMPRKDGYETIREMRAVRPDVKIIAMSGGGHYQLDVLDGLEILGVTATLAKPFEREHLLATVARVLAL